jgi:hypothetical protein
MISTDELRSVMARAWGLPVTDLATTERDDELIRRWSGQMMVAENWMPVRRDPDGVLRVATARVPDVERRAHIEEVLGEPARYVVATSWDIRNLVLTVFHKAIADEAANELFRQNPSLSARVVFSRGQKVGFAVLALVFLVSLVLWPVPTVVTVLTIVSVAFLASTVFKFFVAMRGASYDVVEKVTRAQVDALTDAELPKYTVLVPVFKEANIVPQLVGNLGRIDYPPTSSRCWCSSRRKTSSPATRTSARTRRPTSTSSRSPRAPRRPSRARATWGCSSPRATSSSSTTRRTPPTPTS